MESVPNRERGRHAGERNARQRPPIAAGPRPIDYRLDQRGRWLVLALEPTWSRTACKRPFLAWVHRSWRTCPASFSSPVVVFPYLPPHGTSGSSAATWSFVELPDAPRIATCHLSQDSRRTPQQEIRRGDPRSTPSRSLLRTFGAGPCKPEAWLAPQEPYPLRCSPIPGALESVSMRPALGCVAAGGGKHVAEGRFLGQICPRTQPM